jgi:5'-methylthioadenosine phosphorylase
MAKAQAEIGVIGGSGFYAFLEHAVDAPVKTPYGAPSETPVVGDVGDRRVAFIPRHGKDHRFPPHGIPYRANLWALRALGVRQVIAPCAVGGLRPELGPGSLVVPDQMVDRTRSREQTYFDVGAVHVSFADPYCPNGRAAATAAAQEDGWPVVDGGAMVVIEGPRFSTRAESQWFTAQGWTVVNMTGHPEAVLARELALCYTAVALVTDLDAGITPHEAVTQEEVFRVFGESIPRLRTTIASVIHRLPRERNCPCARALDGIDTGIALP